MDAIRRLTSGFCTIAALALAPIDGAVWGDDQRLDPHGVGPLAPVAPNTSEQGRQLNRRVELVAR